MAIQEATLHEETLSELGLSKQPFVEDKKMQRFTDSETQRTRAALEQHLRFGDSLHLLLGDEGAGKTVLLSQLIKHCKSSIKPFVVKGSDVFQAKGFLHAVLQQLDPDTEIDAESTTVDSYIEQLAPLFEQINEDQYSVVLAVDDAHLAPLEEIAELVDITRQFETEGGKTARLLLTGHPELKLAINRIENQVDNFDLHYSTNYLAPMDEPRVREYLSSRLNQAGFADAFPFTDKAINKIQRDSGGLPASVNTEATHYLNGVYRGANETKGTAARGGALLGGLSWPAIAIGVGALGAIGWGLSLFFGNKPETQVVPITEVATIEQVDEQMEIVEPLVEPIVEPSAAAAQPQIETQVAQTERLPVPQSQPVTEIVKDTSTDLVPEVPQPTVAGVTEPLTQDATASLVNETTTEPTQPLVVETAQSTDVPQQPVFETSTPDKNIAQRATPATVTTEPSNETAPIETVASGVNVTFNGDTDAASIAPQDGVAIDVGGNDPTNVEITAPDRAIENERWVLFQEPTKFTVQLATSRERGYIIDLAQTMDVTDPVAIYPFLTSNSNNPVFGLLSGLYETRSEAIAAVESMSEANKKFGVWIRPVSDLQADIKRRN